MSRKTAAHIDEEAARWVARQDSASWDARQEAELAAWIAADPRHDGALLRAQAAWEMLRPNADLDDAAIPVSQTRIHVGRRGLLVGASLLAASLSAGIAFWPAHTVYSTDIGEMRRVPLSDGSTAAINTASTISVKFDSSARRVTLKHGEAWFQVAHEPSRPFIVEAGPIRVRAVGTAFSVRLHDDGSDVLVTEGVVRAWVDGAEGQAIRLAAGDRAFLSNNAAVSRQAAQPLALDRALAWRDGRIDLVAQPLGEAVAEFNRYNRRQLRLVDQSLAHEEFDGVFRTDDPLGFARMVEVSLNVPVDASDPDHIDIGTRRSE